MRRKHLTNSPNGAILFYIGRKRQRREEVTGAPSGTESGAGTGYAVIGTLNKGDKVKIFADENDWLRFEMEDGRIGYVYDQYMEAVGQ